MNEKILVIPKDTIENFSKNPLVKSLYITDIGFFPNAQYHYIDRKEGSEQNILIYCSKGEGFVVIDGKTQKISKHTFLLIPKNTPHIYGSSVKDPWDIYWMHFNGELADFYFPTLYNAALINIPLSSMPVLLDLFDTIFEALARGYNLSNFIYACQCFSFFLASAFHMPYNRQDHRNKHIKYIEESITFMEENIDKMLSLEDLSKLHNLSKTQLTEVFKEKTGYSPIDFFIHLKIQKSCSYLDFTDLHISEICQKVGYSDPYYFSRIFKRVMGLSPSAYKKIKKG